MPLNTCDMPAGRRQGQNSCCCWQQRKLLQLHAVVWGIQAVHPTPHILLRHHCLPPTTAGQPLTTLTPLLLQSVFLERRAAVCCAEVVGGARTQLGGCGAA